MGKFLQNHVIEFVDFLAANHPELYFKFPQGFNYVLRKYDIDIPSGILTQAEHEQFKSILHSWQLRNGIL